MSQPVTPFSISAPGFYGLNLQDSPVDLTSNFALEASNCVIDKSGRVAARKGWVKANTANAQLSTSNVTCIGELIENDGTATTVCTGGAYLFKLASGALTTLTYGGGGVALVDVLPGAVAGDLDGGQREGLQVDGGERTERRLLAGDAHRRQEAVLDDGIRRALERHGTHARVHRFAAGRALRRPRRRH